MSILNVTEARAKLYSLIDEITETHQPIVITGKRGNAVLISESDWNAISETLYLLSVPGMRESIKEGLEEDISACDREIDW
jgi:prevent-host-death family protein